MRQFLVFFYLSQYSVKTNNDFEEGMRTNAHGFKIICEKIFKVTELANATYLNKPTLSGKLKLWWFVEDKNAVKKGNELLNELQKETRWRDSLQPSYKFHWK